MMKTPLPNHRFVAIAGTWGQRDPEAAIDPWRDWWHPQSHWASDMRTLGWLPLRPDPFRWSTDLDGVWWERLLGRNESDWMAAAYALAWYCEGRPLPVLIAHSHGGQVALLAIAKAYLRVRGLITVCTPVRRDVLDQCAGRWPRPWVHVYGDWADRWQWLGEIGDGAFGIVRRMPVDGVVNVALGRGHGHSGLLTTPEGLRRWPEVVRTYAKLAGGQDVESQYVRG